MSGRVAGLLLAALVSLAPAARAQDEAARAVQATVERAAKAREAGRADDMKREMAQAVKITGDKVALRRVLAGALVDQGFPELAVQVCAQTIALAPDDAALHGIHGIALTKTKKYPEAAAELDLATAKAPERKEWWVHLGRARLLANQEALALAAIERAAKLAPDDVEVLAVRAECEYRNMRLEQCEATCLLLLKKDPKNPMGWQLLIRVRRTQARTADAMASADDAVKAMGRHPDILIERGLALLLADRNEEAVKDLREAAEQLPKDPRPQLHLCKALTRLGRVKEAADAKARYLELSPDVGKPGTRKSDTP
jgi:predicted Zn-dependent protease